MKKKQLGNIFIICLAALNILLWLIFPPHNNLKTDYTSQLVGEAISSTAMVLISITLILSARIRYLEPYFGGLDQMYQSHKQVSIAAFLLLIAHMAVIPESGNPVIGKPLGVLSFVGILSMVLISISPRIPLVSRFLNLSYQKWQIAHKFLGLCFIIGLVHYFLVDTLSRQSIPGFYMLLLSGMGICAYLYKQLLSTSLEPGYEYIVEQINHLNGTSMEIVLKPANKPITFKAGQFAYIHFKDEPGLSEPHPFTISSSPKDKSLRLTIKGSGDWTGTLRKNLKPGAVATIRGGFGMFNYKDSGKEQIWIAGGIGVTPFLSWIRDLNGRPDRNVDFYYSVRSESDAIFLDEFEAVARKSDNFRVNIHYAQKDGHLAVEKIAENSQGKLTHKDIYLCGPIKMSEGFARSFKELGVPAEQIHYEEFNFR